MVETPVVEDGRRGGVMRFVEGCYRLPCERAGWKQRSVEQYVGVVVVNSGASHHDDRANQRAQEHHKEKHYHYEHYCVKRAWNLSWQISLSHAAKVCHLG